MADAITYADLRFVKVPLKNSISNHLGQDCEAYEDGELTYENVQVSPVPGGLGIADPRVTLVQTRRQPYRCVPVSLVGVRQPGGPGQSSPSALRLDSAARRSRLVTRSLPRRDHRAFPTGPMRELVSRLLHLHFRDCKTKVSGDALQLMAELLRIFVIEAAVRGVWQAQSEDLDVVNVDQLEKVLPQLLLDF